MSETEMLTEQSPHSAETVDTASAPEESKSVTEDKTNEAANVKQEGATLVDAVFELGMAWARYGLVVGKLALKTGAQTLDTTADVLGQLASTFDKKDAA